MTAPFGGLVIRSRSRTLAGLLALFIASLAGCSGKEGGPSPSPARTPPPGDPAITDADLARHRQTMAALGPIIDALLATSASPSSEAIAAAIAAAPGVLATGVVGAPEPAAWAELPPGRVFLTVAATDDPSPAASVAPARPRPAGPVGTTAAAAPTAPTFLMITKDGIEAAAISGLFESKGYQVRVAEPTLAELRDLHAPNVLMVSAHAGMLVDASFCPTTVSFTNDLGEVIPGCFAMQTHDPVPPGEVNTWDPTILLDLKARRLGYRCRRSDCVLSINERFAQTYFRFPEESVALFNICRGASPERASGWMATMIKAGLSRYLSFDNKVLTIGGPVIALRFFDRLLGTNRVEPIPDPPQRPFDADGVLKELHDRGQDFTRLGDGTTAYLRIFPLPGASGLSAPAGAPTIETATADARKGKISAAGTFRKDPGPGRRSVKVAGVEIPVTSWKQTAIEADLPPGLNGDLVITADGVDSNPVQLTEWHATITHASQTWLYYSPANGSQGSATFDVRFRADVHDYRAQAGEPPMQQVQAVFELDQGSRLSGGGSATFAGRTTTFTGDTTFLGRLDYSSAKGWLNSQTWGFPLATDFVDGIGWIDVTAKKLYLFLYGQLGGGSRTYGGDFGTAWSTTGGTCNLKYVPENGAHYLVLDLLDSFTVAPGSCTWQIPCIFGADCQVANTAEHTLSWTFVTAAPPDLQAPR